VTVTPYKYSSESKKSQVSRMFDGISGRYDLLNHLMSFGIDRSWRKKAIAELRSESPVNILDIATGTADLAIEGMRLNPAKIFGIDISPEMLAIGRNKIRRKGFSDRIELLEGDSENLIFDDNKFDAITVAFGVRNFENLEKGLQEMKRVLKPGGKVIILEFSQPGNSFFRKLYTWYSSRITPRIGKLISRDKAAYTYLHESVKAFPSGTDFTKILQSLGFRETSFRPLTFGVVTLYSARK